MNRIKHFKGVVIFKTLNSMRRKILLTFLLPFFIGIIAVYGQEDLSVYSTGKLKKLGIKALADNEPYKAIRFFEEYLKAKEDPIIMYQLAESYRYTRNYPFAQYWYDKAYKGNPKKNAKALYYYATMLKTAQQYDDAGAQFKVFRKQYVDYKDSDLYKKKLRHQIISTDSAQRMIAKPIDAKITRLGSSINTESSEFMPIYLANNSLIYASQAIDSLYTSGETPKVELYGAKKEGTDWSNIGAWKLEGEGTENLSINQGAFSPDFQRFYFTRCEKQKKYGMICKIYVSKNVFGVWQEPELLPEIINGKNISNIQVAVGTESRRNDEVLYFVSDRPGGQGGLDIWFTIFMPKKNEWRAPRNCGNKINSASNELSPYYDNETRTLYFSSSGLAGLGEYDIFKLTGELGKWTPAENLGYPINSPYDDYYYAPAPDGKTGVFASNRPKGDTQGHETCCDDLYEVNYENVFEIPITGKVFEIEDEEIRKLLDKNFKTENISEKADSAEIRFIKGSTVSLYIGNTNDKVFLTKTETDEIGSYYFDVDPGKDYVLQFENIKTGRAFIPFTTRGIETPDTIKIRDYGINFIPKESLIMKNIYYEFGKYKLTKEQKVALDTSLISLMKEAPEIVVELRSHTDNMGSEEFNLKLSQRRAEDIVSYMIKQGVEPNRISGIGFGFSMPLAPNTNPDGTDNEEGRAKNRRTEFKIIGVVQEMNEIYYD